MSILQKWRNVNLRDPLYRNENEFIELYEASTAIFKGLVAAYHHEDELELFTNMARFETFYLIPSVNKTYGIVIRDHDELRRFLYELQGRVGRSHGLIQGSPQKTGSIPLEEKGKEWSLGMPRKEGKFWKWFEDKDTGKPVATEKETKEDPEDEKVQNVVASEKRGRKSEVNREGKH